MTLAVLVSNETATRAAYSVIFTTEPSANWGSHFGRDPLRREESSLENKLMFVTHLLNLCDEYERATVPSSVLA